MIMGRHAGLVPVLTKERLLELCGLTQVQWDRIRTKIEKIMNEHPLVSNINSDESIDIMDKHYLPILSEKFQGAMKHRDSDAYTIKQYWRSSIRFVKNAETAKKKNPGKATAHQDRDDTRNVQQTAWIHVPPAPANFKEYRGSNISGDGSHQKKNKKRKRVEDPSSSTSGSKVHGASVWDEIESRTDSDNQETSSQPTSNSMSSPIVIDDAGPSDAQITRIEVQNTSSGHQRRSRVDILQADNSEAIAGSGSENLSLAQRPEALDQMEAIGDVVKGLIIIDGKITHESRSLSTWVGLSEIILPNKLQEFSYNVLIDKIKERLPGTSADAENGLTWVDEAYGSTMLVKSDAVLKFIASQTSARKMHTVRLDVKQPPVQLSKRQQARERRFNRDKSAANLSTDGAQHVEKKTMASTHNTPTPVAKTTARYGAVTPGRSRPGSPSHPQQSIEQSVETSVSYLFEPDGLGGTNLGSPELGTINYHGSPELGTNRQLGSPELGTNNRLESPELGSNKRLGSSELVSNHYDLGSPEFPFDTVYQRSMALKKRREKGKQVCRDNSRHEATRSPSRLDFGDNVHPSRQSNIPSHNFSRNNTPGYWPPIHQRASYSRGRGLSIPATVTSSGRPENHV